jgi:hypothetical protein
MFSSQASIQQDELSWAFQASSFQCAQVENDYNFDDFIVPDTPLFIPEVSTPRSDPPTARTATTQEHASSQQTDAFGTGPDLQVEEIDINIPFRLAAKSVFLTFPKCTIPIDRFNKAVKKWGFEHYYAVQENHRDGTEHFHVLGEWAKKKNIKSARHFDIEGFHPNIGRTRNRLAAWRYLHKTKGRSTHIGGNMTIPKAVKSDLKNDFWSGAVKETDGEKFAETFKLEAPKEFILHYSNVKAYMRDTFQPKEDIWTPPEMDGTWAIPTEVRIWFEENMSQSKYCMGALRAVS